MGPSTPTFPPRRVIAVATLFWPSTHACPLAPNAAEAKPTTSASSIARPTTAEVALPTDSALRTMLFNMLTVDPPLPSRSEMGGIRPDLCNVACTPAYMPRHLRHILQM